MCVAECVAVCVAMVVAVCVVARTRVQQMRSALRIARAGVVEATNALLCVCVAVRVAVSVAACGAVCVAVCVAVGRRRRSD